MLCVCFSAWEKFASPNQGCNGGWYTAFPNKLSKFQKQIADHYKVMENWEITGSVLGPVHKYQDIYNNSDLYK